MLLMSSQCAMVAVLVVVCRCVESRSIVETVNPHLSSSAITGPLVAYFSSTASTRPNGYAHLVSNTQPVAAALDAIIYGQFRFDDETFDIELDSTIDYARDFADLAQLKATNSALKVLLSVGGPTFPSSSWSKAVSSKDNRALLISSIQVLVSRYNLDGVEIDWDYPCSGKKTIYITRDPYTNEGFAEIDDTGMYDGITCTAEIVNLQSLTSELRSAVGEDKTLTFAMTRDASAYTDILSHVDPYIDHFMIKAYGYAVSSDAYGTSSTVTAPFQPIESGTGVVATLAAFSAISGFTASKTIVVMPAWGSAYSFEPGRDTSWKSFGGAATKSGCNGPYANTYSSYISDATHECGQMTYRELLLRYDEEHSDLKEMVQDDTTKSDLTFLFSKSLLVAYSGESAAKTLESQVTTLRFGGIALASIDMDSFNVTGRSDYMLTRTLCEALHGSRIERCTNVSPDTTTPSPNSGKGCNHVDHTAGTYCYNTSSFLICPNNVTENCPLGTVCKQPEEHAIACDWPDLKGSQFLH
eukprot:m.29764 g.29764  ORF g.29764 m.29764 type:complete len:527 (-) comp16155_c1_seq1:185-1765(-)